MGTPGPPEEPAVEVPVDLVKMVISGMRRGNSAGGDGLTAERVQAWTDSAKAVLAGSFATIIEDRSASGRGLGGTAAWP